MPIAYSMGQIIKSVCVCQWVSVSVYLSVCGHSHGRISWSIFTKTGIDVTLKSKNEFVGGQYRTTLSPILPPPKHVRSGGPKNPCKYWVILYLPLMYENRRNFRVLWEIGIDEHVWRHILDRKWKYGRFVHARCIRHSGHDYRNSSFIVDVAMGQIPRSTERISSLKHLQQHTVMHETAVND